jgi:bifunctional DNA-binding transcriptional regulator/antitoxin component of YhaV-PrlF toxin-antitoxin module
MPEQANEALSWTISVDEEGILKLPDEILDRMGWKEGDLLEWLEQTDGSFLLVKANELESTEIYSTIEKISDDAATGQATEHA